MNPQESGARGWPLPLQIVVSLALIYHMAGLLVGALAVPPSAAIERQAVPYFKRYFELTNQGYSYRYYSRLDTTVDAAHPHPWGTPIMTADMEFKGEDGQVVRNRLTAAILLSAGYILIEDEKTANHEGRLKWDDPVRNYVPFFHLGDPLADREVTLRDLVCHRTGLRGHDLLWYRSLLG